MTDKQIIIDGVDVSGCFHYKTQSCVADYLLTDLDFSNAKCACSPNCYFKQLARKTAECEELKAYAQAQENQRETYYKEFLKLSQENKELKRKVELMMDCPDCKVDEYKKALEEIERICLEDVHIFADGTELRYDSLDDILDIINKLKGGNDE